MFGWFKKKKTTEDIISTAHTQTHDLFSTLGIVRNLAMLHKLALEGEASDEECNDLVMGAYRTLYLAAGVAKHRAQDESKDPAVGNQAANSILNGSGLSNIAQMIKESIPSREFEPLLALGEEVQYLFQAATILDRLVKKRRLEEAHEVWRACAKGSYGELRLYLD